MLATFVRRQLDAQATGIACPMQRFITAQQLNFFNGTLEETRITCQRLDGYGTLLRPGQDNSIQFLSSGGKANVLTGEGSAFGIVECSSYDPCGPLAEDFPGACSVDRFSISDEPAPDTQQYLLLLLWNR